MKSSVKDLAYFGGKPTFGERVHVGRPNIGNRERFLERVNDIFDRRWLSNNGPYVQEFEQRLAELLGVKHAIVITNGTVALEIAIRALDLTGEVIVPSFTFIATAHALQWQQIKPAFCDVDPKTHNISPYHIERMITPNTTGIMGVHLWGRPCDTEAIAEIAQRHNLKVMYDAAHAFHASHNGRMIGNFGDAEVFSFHATKFFNSLEGGAITTNNDELATKMRLMKNFGFSGYDTVIHLGVNGKMNEVAAAMGLTGLESLDEVININKRNYEHYQKELKGIPGISLLSHDSTEKRNYQYIVIEIDQNITHVSRDKLLEILYAENILARRYFYPGCHKMEPYCSYSPHAGLLLPETERLTQRVLVLPTGTTISPEDISEICNIIRLVVGQWQSVRSLMLAELTAPTKKPQPKSK